ncbi:pyrroline-5-carboxylate reductase [Polaromonas sp. OV174]|uniref:pyrroline-5-carboxylate reductase n=1 Tax=Polaromonas sp. OV174 TaxID=1855300 RepID=UPI0008F3C564|nr:pyrroline-5-carboxylate reductase [Polaromonas sp. OV174]SFC63558.1 pyrroline-5-carboxylate reductase [Polaromonas sp. OV174]
MSSPLTAKSHPRLAFIGGGQMASAMIAGLVRAGQDSSSILVVEPMLAQREHLEQTLQVTTAACADERLSAADVVVWAVKPQVLHQALDTVQAHLGAALHVSIAAGLPLKTLSQWLQSQRVVRAMPNTAALVGAGVTGMAAAEGVSEADRRLAAAVLAATGHCFWVDSDERIDAVTAVSGSGPAYVFHFLEAFQAAAEAVGFDPEMARELVLRTAVGAIEQAKRGEPFSTLRSRVTSRHGTTEAALNLLNAQGTPQAVHDAVLAAYDRAGALALELSAPIA